MPWNSSTCQHRQIPLICRNSQKSNPLRVVCTGIGYLGSLDAVGASKALIARIRHLACNATGRERSVMNICGRSYAPAARYSLRPKSEFLACVSLEPLFYRGMANKKSYYFYGSANTQSFGKAFVFLAENKV